MYVVTDNEPDWSWGRFELHGLIEQHYQGKQVHKQPTEAAILANGHTTLNAPVLVRSPTLSNVGPG